MRKQLLVSVGVLCVASVSLIGQNKYNNLMTDQLFGAVKEVNTIRKSYMENDGKGTWFVDSKWSTTYDSYGYITNSEEYTYQWNATYTQCSCETPPRSADYDPDLYGSYKFNVNTMGNEYQFKGECNKYLGTSKTLVEGGADAAINYEFDDNGRLLTLKNFADLLLDLSMSDCFSQTFSYKGAEKLPYEAQYKLDWDLGDGGRFMAFNLSISYVKTDSKGNWLHRKIYDMEDDELLFEETRTITYYPVAPPSSASIQPAS